MSALYGSILKVIEPFIYSKALTKVRIEEWTFRLHFRVTTTILLFCSALICMKEYIGDHIKCASAHDDDDPVVPRKVIERYCFIQTTFTVPWDFQGSNGNARNYYEDTRLGGPPFIPDHSETIHHAYYQWVSFFLFFQALVFYAPHKIWKSYENNKIRNLVQGIHIRDLEKESTKRKHEIVSVATYIINSRGSHGFWTFMYIACEFGNLLVVLANLYLTDLFLGHTFSTYGVKVLAFIEQDSELREDPMATVFPRMTKCIFHTFGPSGSIQRADALCVLPLNILNEKIFIFLWFWFVLLALISVYAIVKRFGTIFSKKLRLKQLQVRVYPTKTQAVAILNRVGYSEWMILNLLRINMSHGSFYSILGEIYEEMM